MYIRRRTIKRIIHFVLLLLILIPVMLIVLHISSKPTEAECIGKTSSYKYYTTYEVSEGDSLWSIAKRNYTEHYKDYNEYISEVMTINHLDSDALAVGKKLCIPYYSESCID